ncbi:MAG: AAA family ATPase [Phycisphaeraceae bacterium]
MNQKGGVGKTTTCTNLGAALSRMGKRVLLIDLDPQAHLSLSLGIEPDGLEKSMYDLLTDPDVDANQVIQPVKDNALLSVLPAEVNLAGVEAELADKVVTGMAQTVLKQKVSGLISAQGQRAASRPDYVLIDCPPSLGLLTVNALTLASEVIVPMQAHFLALQGLGKLFETISMMRQGINPNLKVAGIVLCMHEGNTILASEVINDVNNFLSEARGTDAPWADAVIYHPPIRRNIKLAESPSFGQSIFDYAPDCHGAQDYAKLAESVIGQLSETVQPRPT